MQTKPSWLSGVVYIAYEDDAECPLTGCQPILLDNWSVKFMNYGYNLNTELSLAGFLLLEGDKISLTITNSSFEYNII